MIKYVLVYFLFLSSTFANNNVDENELIDFNSIKDVLKKDMLDVEVKKKKEAAERRAKAKHKKYKKRYNIPSEKNFWTFMSELWLVKNAPIIKWDFKKIDYGIETDFSLLLERIGFYEKKFKLLIINSPDITHFALPSDEDEYIFLLSLPFIKTLDLTKMEISLLLLEDMMRADIGYFKKKVNTEKVKKLLGSNFFDKKKIDKSLIHSTMTEYDKFVFTDGFTFQQQFEVTKRMDKLLKSDMKMWSTYNKLIRKVDDLVKSNLLYKKYTKIYPSPELQINWLNPKTK